jgi:hypothetical protein
MVVCEIDGKSAVINRNDVGDFLDFEVELSGREYQPATERLTERGYFLHWA